jgi:hypothetical protein
VPASNGNGKRPRQAAPRTSPKKAARPPRVVARSAAARARR